MGKVDSDQEILEFAIFRENEAHNFYMALAGRVEDENIKKILEDLATEELDHKAKLELEIMKNGRTVSTELTPPRSSSDYILADDLSQLDMDARDVLLMGMEKEEASFRIFVNMIPKIHDEQSRELLLALAEEEVKHKLRFEIEYNNMLHKKT